MLFQIFWSDGAENREVQSDVVVGRRDGDILFATDDRMSGRHAQFTLQGDMLYVTDLGSTNGTTVNGTKTIPHVPHQLKTGDEIKIGNQIFRAKVESDRTVADFQLPNIGEKTVTEVLDASDKTYVERPPSKETIQTYRNVNLSDPISSLNVLKEVDPEEKLPFQFEEPVPFERKFPTRIAVLLALIFALSCFLIIKSNKAPEVVAGTTVTTPDTRAPAVVENPPVPQVNPNVPSIPVQEAQPLPVTSTPEVARAAQETSTPGEITPLEPDNSEITTPGQLSKDEIRRRIAEYAASLRKNAKSDEKSSVEKPSSPHKKKAKVVAKITKAKAAKKLSSADKAFDEAQLFGKLEELKAEYQLSKSTRAKNALELDASDLITKHYEALREKAKKQWLAGRNLASDEKSKLKKAVISRIVTINNREKQINNSLDAFFTGSQLPKSGE